MIALQERPLIGRDDVTFDPGQWLARYVELGGGYAMVGDAIWLHWLISLETDEAALRRHERVLRGRPDRREAVKDLILCDASREKVDG